jgi:hypothetical protein
MKATIAFLSESERCRGTAGSSNQPQPLEVVVPYTKPALAAPALSAALELARGFDAGVTLMAVYVLPYAAPLECQEGIRTRLEAELAAVARTSPIPICARLVFARDRESAFQTLLPRNALVVIGAKHHWWRTPEERFARKLAARGQSVAVIRVE